MLSFQRVCAMACVSVVCAKASDHPEDVDHPLDGRTFKLWATGTDDEAMEQGISFTDGSHWLYASYPKFTDVMPVLFKAVPGYPNQYKLQNKWFSGRSGQWISFQNGGMWLRAIYNEDEAMPIYFDQVASSITTRENNTLKEYKMKNMYPGQDGWISYKSGTHAMRSGYTLKDAMTVALFDVDVPDGPATTTTTTTTLPDGRRACSSGNCYGGRYSGGCSNGVCTGTDGLADDCLCICLAPWDHKSCPAPAIVNNMNTMELATAKKIPEQGWISMPAIAVGAGVAAAFGLFGALEAKRRLTIQEPDSFVALDDAQPSC